MNATQHLSPLFSTYSFDADWRSTLRRLQNQRSSDEQQLSLRLFSPLRVLYSSFGAMLQMHVACLLPLSAAALPVSHALRLLSVRLLPLWQWLRGGHVLLPHVQ